MMRPDRAYFSICALRLDPGTIHCIAMAVTMAPANTARLDPIQGYVCHCSVVLCFNVGMPAIPVPMYMLLMGYDVIEEKYFLDMEIIYIMM